jgi:aryl carrier-like protein
LDKLSEASVATGKDNANNGKSDDIKAVLENARERGSTVLRDLVAEILVDRIAHFVMLNTNQIDPARTLSTYGMDSMIGAELRAWLRRDIGVDVPFMALLDQNLTFLGLADVVTAGIESA